MQTVRKYLVWAVFCCFVLGVRSAGAKIFDMEEFRLDNGLQVIVIPNRKAPIVRQMIWYKVGSVDEALGKGGTAHLLEHLMFRGTKKVKNSDFNAIIARNGGESNAFTAQDFTAYYETTDVSRLELAMALEADRMENLDFGKKAFDKERDVVFQERMQVVENNPSSYFGESLRRVLWQQHPYSRPISGSPEEIKSVSRADVMDFYRRYYAPNNAILLLSGDIEPKTAKLLAEKYFGKIKPRPVGAKADFPKLDRHFAGRLEMKLPQIKTVRLTKSYIAPSFNTNREAVYPLLVLSAYLGEGETSKLYKKLVLEEKNALGVSVAYDFASRSYGGFSISAMPKEDVDAKAFETALDKAVKEALAEISVEEIEKTKGKMLAGQVYLRDNPNDAAYIAGSMAAVGMSVEDIENHADNIRKVSAGDVRKAAEKLFGRAINVTGVIKPEKEDPQAILEDAILKEKNFDTEVKEITSPKAKIKAYLFQDKTNPIISINFLFKNAGLSTDETQQSGISTMAAALLTEGAGNLDSQQFKEILEQKAVGMGFSADMDDFSGHLLTTRENMNTAFKMLNMAMTQPRFDEEDIRRTKAQMLAVLKRQTEHPSGVLALEAAKEIFGKHPYARNPVGDAAAIAKIGRSQLLEFVRNHLSKSNLMVGIAGDVSEEEAGKIVDALFGSLPESGRIVFVREAEIDFDGRVKNISLPSAQVVSSFAAKGIGRTHPDFYPLFIANHILGGSGLSSRLSTAAREKEGLTYGIDTYLSLLDKAPMLRGGFSATPDNFARVVEIVRRQWAEMGRKGVSEEELAEAKDYLIASYNLRFASIDTISAILVYMQKDNLGLDFLQKRNDYVRQVKLKDVNRVAREYFNPEKMIFVNVGSFEKQGVR